MDHHFEIQDLNVKKVNIYKVKIYLKLIFGV